MFSKYAWVVPLKDKKEVSIVNAFQKNLDSSKRKPNKIWGDQGSEFYNSVFRKSLKDNDISMYSTYNEGKSVVAERFIKTLKKKIYKHMTSDSFAEYNEKSNEKDPKFKVGDHVRISKFKNVFAKGYTSNWSEEIFVLKK